MRNVGEQRPERDDELDLELVDELEHERRIRLPAQVRLDAEQDHRIAVEARDRRVEEGVRRPFDLARQPVLERDVRAHGLKVVEVLGVDLRERLGSPLLREVAAAERRSLAAVVPASERGNEHRAAERGPRGDDQLRHRPSLGCRPSCGVSPIPNRAPETRGEPDRPADESGSRRHVQQDEPPRDVAVRPVLHFADDHLRRENRKQSRAAAHQPRVGGAPHPCPRGERRGRRPRTPQRLARASRRRGRRSLAAARPASRSSRGSAPPRSPPSR